MPAAAVIPAQIAYINFVAVKTLVVQFQDQRVRSAVKVCTDLRYPHYGMLTSALN